VLLGSVHVKASRKTLAKLTPGVNFANILCAALTLVDPKSVKRIDNLTVFFTLLGSAHVKASPKMLAKLAPGWRRGKLITI